MKKAVSLLLVAFTSETTVTATHNDVVPATGYGTIVVVVVATIEIAIVAKPPAPVLSLALIVAAWLVGPATRRLASETGPDLAPVESLAAGLANY